MLRPLLLALGAWLLLPACTHLARAPTLLSEEAGFKQESVEVPAGMAPKPPEPFRLRPGDVLSLRIVSLTPFEVARLSVDDIGVLYVPLVGAIPVGGLTLDEAEGRVHEGLRRFDKFGIVSLSVVEPAGHQASVLGAVNTPGIYMLAAPMRVSELLARAGGARSAALQEAAELIEYSDLEAARLIRDGVPLPISIPLAMVGDPLHNTQIKSGDVLFVPSFQGAAISVYGDVREPRPVPWRKGLRLSDAVSWAGGLTHEADLGDIRVIRGPLSKPRVYRASVADFIKGQGADVELARGDIVFVTRHWYYTTTDVIQRLTPLMTVGAAAAVGARLQP
jgi:polysaccharide export outer membrane protein